MRKINYLIYILLVSCCIFVGCKNAILERPINGPVEGPMPPNHNETPFMGDNSQPQDREQQFEQIKMQKIAYMTQHLNLTVEESEKFWPVYNQYWELYMKLQHEQFSTNKKIEKKESTSMSDVDDMAKYYEQRAALIRKWGDEFAKVIKEEKVAKVFVAEEKFKNYLIRKGPWRPNKSDSKSSAGNKKHEGPEAGGPKPEGPQRPD